MRRCSSRPRLRFFVERKAGRQTCTWNAPGSLQELGAARTVAVHYFDRAKEGVPPKRALGAVLSALRAACHGGDLVGTNYVELVRAESATNRGHFVVVMYDGQLR